MTKPTLSLDRITWTASLTAFVGCTAMGYAVFKFRSKQTPTGGAARHLSKIVEYSLSATIIQVADRLNLFEHLHEMGPCTSQQLATKLGWSERWLQELLLQLTASGLCVYHQHHQQQQQQPTFVLKPEYAALLRGPDQEMNSIAGTFQFLSALVSREDALVQAVQTGHGIDYDFGKEGKDIGAALDRKNGNFFRHKLFEELNKIRMPQTGEQLVQRLREGIDVADIGCGFGTSTVSMAKNFPNSRFYAFESSPKALQAIEANIQVANISNVTICKVPDRTLGDGPDLHDPSSVFHFVYAHDVMHDMLNPRELIKDVKKRLSNNGCWLIVDIDCRNKVVDNLRLPNAAMLYAFSCLLCLSMATSEPHGEGLGTCGFSPQLAENWMKKAGFNHFEKWKIPSLPYNICYLVA
jgi:2-polyprenyl-3-methyl-5-hydroxy-6-metoxy-1,4-benzoquinol methylase